MNIDELIKEIKSLTKDEIYEIRDALDKAENGKKEEKLRAAVKEHRRYVGKCYKKRVKPCSKMFPEMWRYYKVISERSENEYHMEVLTFDERPTYWFEYQSHYQSHKGYLAGDFLGGFDFSGIHVTNYPLFCFNHDRDVPGTYIIDTLTEISIDEYNRAMDNYVKELQGLTWYADHCRFGNTLPTDPDWPREDRSED